MLFVTPGMVIPNKGATGWRFYVLVNGERVDFPGIPHLSATETKELMRKTVSALNSV